MTENPKIMIIYLKTVELKKTSKTGEKVVCWIALLFFLDQNTAKVRKKAWSLNKTLHK